METMSARLVRFRTKSGLSAEEVARRLNLSPSTYRGWEYGALIKGEPYVALAEVFNVSLTELMTGQKSELETHFLAMEELMKHIRRSI